MSVQHIEEGCSDPGRRGQQKGRRGTSRDHRQTRLTLLIGSLLGCLMGGLLVVTSRPTMAHHSFSMFDFGAPIELDGTVQEFRYTNPHSFIVLKARGPDGRIATWTLEGMAPAVLERDG
jgi:hypothetical protein